jgi:hypothetical protein
MNESSVYASLLLSCLGYRVQRDFRFWLLTGGIINHYAVGAGTVNDSI